MSNAYPVRVRPRRPGKLARNLWLLLPTALCTLAAHAVAYRSFFPAGAAHRYLGWYEPLICSASLASLIAFAALLLLAVGARESRTLATLLQRLASWLRSQGSADLWARLATGSLALLVVQEALERSFTVGAPQVGALSASAWLSALVTIGVLAAFVAAVARSGLELVQLVLGGGLPRRSRRIPPAPRAATVFVESRRSSPLAERRGVRAPPALTG